MTYSDNDLRRKAQAFHKRTNQGLLKPATIQDSSDLDPATNKVRVYREDIRQVVVVNSLIRTVGLPVWLIEMPDKELYVYSARIPDGAVIYGDALAANSTPIGGGETVVDPQHTFSFTPGLVTASELGDLYVHVKRFYYADGWWDDGELSGTPTVNDFDLTSYLTAASGYSQWIVVYFDPADAALHAIADAGDTFGAPSVLDETLIVNITLPYGVYPLGAVGLANGQTTITGSSRFAERRIFLDANGVVEAGWLVKTDTIVPTGASMVQAGTVRAAATLTLNGTIIII